MIAYKMSSRRAPLKWDARQTTESYKIPRQDAKKSTWIWIRQTMKAYLQLAATRKLSISEKYIIANVESEFACNKCVNYNKHISLNFYITLKVFLKSHN